RRQHRRRRAARDYGLELAALPYTAGEGQQFLERQSQRHLEVAGLCHVTGHREDLGAAVVGLAQVREPLATVQDDAGGGGEGLGVIHRGRTAEGAEVGRERRLEARLALLAFQRLQECGLLATYISAGAEVVVQVEVHA